MLKDQFKISLLNCIISCKYGNVQATFVYIHFNRWKKKTEAKPER